MSDLITDLSQDLTGRQPTRRPSGHRVAPSGRSAQDPAVARQNDLAPKLGGTQSDFAVAGQSGPAMKDRANHMNWRVQDGLEIKSYAETIAVREVANNAIITLDPKIATIWRIAAAGSFGLAIGDLPDSTVGGQPASRVNHLVLYVQRQAGGAITWPSGTLFGLDVLDPNGDGNRDDSLLLPPEAARMDVFVLSNVPSIGWIGSIQALGLSAV